MYNVACDFNINYTLVDLAIGKIIGEDKLNGGKPCYDPKYAGMNSYEIYDQPSQEGLKQMKGMDVHPKMVQAKVVMKKVMDPKIPTKPLTAEERKELQDEIKQAVLQAAQSAGNDVLPDIKRMIKELTEPQVVLERCATCTDGKSL